MNWLIFRGTFLHWLTSTMAIVAGVSLALSLIDRNKRQTTIAVIGAIIAVALVAAVVAGIWIFLVTVKFAAMGIMTL